MTARNVPDLAPRILELLRGHEAGSADIAACLGATQTSVCKVLRKLRGIGGKTPRRIHVCDTVRIVAADGRRHFVPIYALGDLPDTRPPSPITTEEINRNNWQRRKTRQERQIESIPTCLQAWCLGTREVRV